ncbi:PhaM family polyhydroxyalkanoate granule multifunctional regulatory protein [Candidatus Accumulibacter sp. ACC007]|uniref:PhaM family polyhydroxyalkanoate granule multifunctional regulatory protein n=1 Tax=Candidatus Accumulibacter sp. ACC007 TaxID=2823333 RepID=UPI0025B9D9EB|nr:PhaM family polyhydroxyalkanoate granule multifunctional regulatory protein [Candidatus Accumulibacter sp. ACC007]
MSSNDSLTDPMSFAKKMWGNMGFSLPGMVTPTLDVEEIEKKVRDLKAVESWLKMNLSMLQMTIQGLEMQCVTLNAVRAMGHMGSNLTTAASGGNDDTQTNALGIPGGADALKQATMWPWTMMQQMQEQMKQAAAAAQQAAPSDDEPKKKP